VAAAVAHLVVALLSGPLALTAGCERADDASEVVSAGADSTGASEASTTTTNDATSSTVTTASSSASSTDVDSDTVESTSETMRECMGKLYPASAVLEVDSPSREFNGPGELAELSGIRCVTGWVTIRNVSELAPARSLERAFGLALVQNPGLRHVDDLAALRRIRLALVIDENPDLENLDGIASLEALPDIRVGFESFWAASGTPDHGNDALRSLPSFSSLVEPIDSISIGDNEALVTLARPQRSPSVDYGS